MIFIVCQHYRRREAIGIQYVGRHLSETKELITNRLNIKINSFRYRNRAEYITVLSVITYIAFMVFSSFHFDYDKNITDRFSLSERQKLLKSLESDKIKQKRI